VVAPPEFRCVFQSDSIPGATEVEWHPLPAPERRRSDVFAIGPKIEAGAFGRVEAVLLVVPRSKSPRTASPSAVVGETVVGLVQADHPDELKPWLSSLWSLEASGAWRDSGPAVAVCAMGKRIYRERSADWIRELSESGLATEDWRASLLSREEVCGRLAGGAELVFYLGHGRARGWSGFQALRWHHVTAHAQKHPVGTVIAFACNTLTRTRGVVPFGVHYVMSGRVVAYLGWAGSMTIEEGLRFADRVCDQLARGREATVSQLLRAVVAKVEKPAERRELREMRLLGWPFARLPSQFLRRDRELAGG
jgi:hypothetical protein